MVSLPHLVLVGVRPEIVGKMLGVPVAVTLISRTGTDDAFERKVALHSVAADFSDPARLLACVREIHQRRPVDAMIGGTDPALLATAIAGEALGVRVNPLSAVRCAQDKSALRARLAEAGAAGVAYRICPDVGAVAEFLAAHRRGIVLKPADGHGGRGVFVVRGAADIPAAWDHVAPETSAAGVLAEEFLTGAEASVETMSADGEHRVLAVTAKHTTGPPHRVEVGHETPAGHPPPFAKAAADAALAALDAVGYAWGPAHTEVIVDGGAATVVEINARWGGDRIWEMTELVTGVDMARACVMACCYGKLPVPRAGDSACAVRFLTPRPGRIVSVTGTNDAAATGGVIRIGEMSRIGDVIPPLADSRGRAGYVLATGPDPAAARAIALEAAGLIRVQTIPSGPGSGAPGSDSPAEALREEIRRAIGESLPSVQADLNALDLVSSAGADPGRAADSRRAAEETARLLRAAGAATAEAEAAEGREPVVIARFPNPPGMPTVLLHGRATADGAAGLAAHLVTLRFFGGRPPVGVAVAVACGQDGPEAFPDRYRDELGAEADSNGAGPGSFEDACVAEILLLIEVARRNDRAQPPRPV